jgi:tetratricopeptide (TPR) repeat protein
MEIKKMKGIALLLISGLLFSITAGMNQKEIESAYHSSYQHETAQKYDKAITALSKVYKEYPTGYTVNYRLGWLYYLSANYANAMQNLTAAIHYLSAIRSK